MSGGEPSGSGIGGCGGGSGSQGQGVALVKNSKPLFQRERGGGEVGLKKKILS